jgi:adenylate cyclase
MAAGFLILGALVLIIMGVRFICFDRYQLVFHSAPMLTVTGIQFITGGIFQKSVAHKRAARVTHLFGRYVSKSVVSELVQDDVNVHFKGTQKELTILFSDLRNFTELSEKLSPQQISVLMNTYFGTMIPLVFKHKGTLDKLVGDMIMAFFGAPLPVPDHPAAAVRCALDMEQALGILRKNHSVKGADQLWSGMGINTGQVIVGNLGSEDFIDYTVIGDAVNVASRLEGLNKVYGTRIIISEFTRNQLGNQFLVRKLDKVRLKGKQEPVIIYELMGEWSGADPFEKDWVARFESGLEAYQSADFEKARMIFKECLADFPDDNPAKLYLERIDILRETPPGKDWDGVTLLDHK